MSQVVEHVTDRDLGVVRQRLARGVEPRAEFPRRIHLRVRTLSRDGDVQLYKITRAGVYGSAVLFPVPARPFLSRTPVRESPLTRTMNRRSSKDRRMFVTDDSSDDDDDDVMIMDPPETTSSSSSALATAAAGMRGVPHAPASNSATAAAASDSTYKPLSTHSEELIDGEEEEEEREEDMSRDGPRRVSQDDDDDFTYADPADVRLRAMGNRYGGQSRSAAAASRNDSGSVSPVTLFDEDGYAIIPDPPTSLDDSRHVIVDDDDDGDYEANYTVMAVAPSPPKVARKSRTSTKKQPPEERQASNTGRSRGRSTTRRTPKSKAHQETAPAAAESAGSRQKQRQQPPAPQRRQSYHPPPDYPPPPPPVQATVSRPLPRTPDDGEDDDDDIVEAGPSNARRGGKAPCRRVERTENLYETPISATAVVVDIDDDDDEEENGGAAAASAHDTAIVVDEDEGEDDDCEVCNGEEPAAAASSSSSHRNQPLPVPPSSPRITRELGFLPGVVSGQDARFIAACLHHSHAPQVDIINTCYPMPAYTLDALSEPVLTKKALRCAGVLRPVIKLAIMVNYYCVGIGRLARARALSRDLMTPPRMETLRRRLEGLLPQQTSPSPPMCLRVLGRLNITAAQHKTSCDTIDQLMKPMQERERRKQKTQCAQLFRSKNLLFSPPRFTREGAKALYMRNIKILNSDEEDTALNLVMTLNPHPTRDDVLNDAIFCLSLGNFVYNFSRALEELRGMIRCQFEDLTETMYAAYYQCPMMRDDYRVLCSEVATEITSPREDGQGLSALCRRSLAFARRCYNEGLFFSPSYVKYLIKCAAMEEAGFEGYSLESAARSLANPDIFRPLPDESSARRLLRRTIHFVRVDGTPSSSRQIPTTHIPTHASYELFLQASRMIAPQQQAAARKSGTPPPSSPQPPAPGGPKYSKRTFL
ncbi:M25 protein [Murid betaherpesvirus 1]|nr:M25 protein [Murid betaherpesvirus 1]